MGLSTFKAKIAAHLVHNGEAGAPRNNEKPCTGGSPWPPRPGIPRTLFRGETSHKHLNRLGRFGSSAPCHCHENLKSTTRFTSTRPIPANPGSQHSTPIPEPIAPLHPRPDPLRHRSIPASAWCYRYTAESSRPSVISPPPE